MGGKTLRVLRPFAACVFFFWACGDDGDDLLNGGQGGSDASGGMSTSGGAAQGGMTASGGAPNVEGGAAGQGGSNGGASAGSAAGQAGGGSAGLGGSSGAAGAGGASGGRKTCLDWARTAAGAGGVDSAELFEVRYADTVSVGLDAALSAGPPDLEARNPKTDASAFEWTLLEAPARSALSATNLRITDQGPDGSLANFLIDKPGTYRIEVLGCAEDGRFKRAISEIHGQAFAIPYVLAASEDGVVTASPRSINSAGEESQPLGPQFTASVSSEKEWIASLFERELAARTRAWPGTSCMAYPTGPLELAVTVAPQAQPTRYDAELAFLTCDRVFWTTPAETTGFDVLAANTGEDARSSLRTEGVPVADPLHPIAPFPIQPSSASDPNRIGWVEAAPDRASGFDIWAADDSLTPTPTPLTACKEGPEYFAQVAQIQQTTSPRGLVGLFAREGESSHGQLYFLAEREDGTYDCDATSPDNHLIYQVADEHESILEFDLSAPFGEILSFVKQLADGRSTEIHQAHVGNTEDTPLLLSALSGRNTGLHYFGPNHQIAWTRTQYEQGSGVTRPSSSEIWRMNADGSTPRLLIAHPSTETSAVLVTTGMGN